MGLSTKQVSSDVQDWNQRDLLQSPSGDSGSGSSMESQKPPTKRQQQQQEPNLQPPAGKLKCPRCDSANTKFCYYNNYNKSQPRYFCKACKRHWTKGGMLRNVPVGGGRKNKRLKTSANTTIAATKTSTSANISVLAASFGGKNSNTRVGAHGPDQRISLPLGLVDENTTRKMLSQAILGPQSLLHGSLFNSNMDFSIGKNSSNESNFNGIFGGSSVLSIPQNHDLKFPYPSFSSSDYNFPCSISASGEIPNLYGLNNGESSNPLDETFMTGFDTSLSRSSLSDKPWPSNESTSNWDWDDMDKFVISDVTIPWDDAEIN